ncbi:hypothetical protein ACIRD3_37165 [Kitasatospora sp. NPDC093550]|uniref:hypothetical protein n=1 Tax=Kitasatospora sp. NPDC093550 TaxID=3364089 RepID=UPI003812D4D1
MHNRYSGGAEIWFMDGADRVTARRSVVENPGESPVVIDAPWHIVGTADFDRNAVGDLLLHNADTGETQIWDLDFLGTVMGRGTVTDEGGRPVYVAAPWQIVGTTDFDRDGSPDILWHNTSTGESQIWLMHGRQIAARRDVLDESGNPTHVGAPWQITGVTGPNRYGGPDIVWHNSTTNETQVWVLDTSRRIVERQTVLDENGSPARVGAPWQIVGAKDFDLDGSPDILWRNTSTGETQLWLMNANRIRTRRDVLDETGNPVHVSTPLEIAGIGDF